MVSGTFDEIMRAMELIIEKLSHEVLLLMSPFRLVFFFFSQKPVSFDSLFDLYCLLTLNFGWFVQEEDGNDADGLSTLKLAVPNSSCGAIIGKGGATIK